MKNARIKNKTLGQIRYFSYFLQFPNGEEWVESRPFVHELSFELQNTTFGRVHELYRMMMKTGSCHWKDHNGVTHRVVVEDTPRLKVWGTKKKPQLVKLA